MCKLGGGGAWKNGLEPLLEKKLLHSCPIYDSSHFKSHKCKTFTKLCIILMKETIIKKLNYKYLVKKDQRAPEG